MLLVNDLLGASLPARYEDIHYEEHGKRGFEVGIFDFLSHKGGYLFMLKEQALGVSYSRRLGLEGIWGSSSSVIPTCFILV